MFRRYNSNRFQTYAETSVPLILRYVFRIVDSTLFIFSSIVKIAFEGILLNYEQKIIALVIYSKSIER